MRDARDAEDIRLLDANDHSRLFATYFPVVRERCRLRLNDADADEVTQLVFLRIFTELSRGKTYTVPFRVVVHQVTTWMIKEFLSDRASPLLDPQEWELEAPDPYEEFEQEYDLRRLFSKCPPGVREVLELRYIEGLDPEQIAERLGITRNAVDQRLHRGTKMLREYLNG